MLITPENLGNFFGVYGIGLWNLTTWCAIHCGHGEPDWPRKPVDAIRDQRSHLISKKVFQKAAVLLPAISLLLFSSRKIYHLTTTTSLIEGSGILLSGLVLSAKNLYQTKQLSFAAKKILQIGAGILAQGVLMHLCRTYTDDLNKLINFTNLG